MGNGKYILIALLLLSLGGIAQTPLHKLARKVLTSPSCTGTAPSAIVDPDRTNMSYSSGSWCPTVASTTGQIQFDAVIPDGTTGFVKADFDDDAVHSRMVIMVSYNNDLDGQTEATDYFFGSDAGLYIETTYKTHDNTNGFQNSGINAAEGDEFAIFIEADGPDGDSDPEMWARYYRSGAWHDIFEFPDVTGDLYVYGSGAVADGCFLNLLTCGATGWAAIERKSEIIYAMVRPLYKEFIKPKIAV